MSPVPAETHEQFLDRWRMAAATYRGDVGEIPPGDPDLIDFSGALYALKAGHHVTRDGWNGRGLFVFAQAGYPDGIPANANTAAATGLPEGALIKIPEYLMLYSPPPMRTEATSPTSLRVLPDDEPPSATHWVPSMGDLMANDWRIVPRP
jgi:hypothetical protein